MKQTLQLTWQRRIAAEKQKKKQAAKQRQKLNEQQRGKRDRTEYEQKRGKRDKTQAQKDKAKITRKKNCAASKDKGSKIFDQSRQDAANAECETLGAFRNA